MHPLLLQLTLLQPTLLQPLLLQPTLLQETLLLHGYLLQHCVFAELRAIQINDNPDIALQSLCLIKYLVLLGWLEAVTAMELSDGQMDTVFYS